MEQYIKISIPDFGVEYLQKGFSGKRVQLDHLDLDPYYIGFHFQLSIILRDKNGNSVNTQIHAPKLKLDQDGNLNHIETFLVPTDKDLYIKIERPNGMQPDAKFFMKIKCKVF